MSRARENLEPYRLIRLIRAGQICQVWEATHIDKEVRKERVALKVLREDERTNREQIGLLKHEYEVAHKLDHENIIDVYEFRQDRYLPYLVLELFSSKNLKQVLREGLEQYGHFVPGIIEQAAEGLSYMHKQGWLHCDVKPDNFLLNEEGGGSADRLCDFSTAKNRPGKTFCR